MKKREALDLTSFCIKKYVGFSSKYNEEWRSIINNIDIIFIESLRKEFGHAGIGCGPSVTLWLNTGYRIESPVCKWYDQSTSHEIDRSLLFFD
jgi:hypothetical protein